MVLTEAVTLAAWMDIVRSLVVVVFILICLLLIGVVLIQKGRGGGLSSAFGGAMGASPFGTKTGDVFTWITVVLAGLFLLVAALMTKIYVGRVAETAAPEAPPVRGPAVPGAEGGGEPASQPEE